jgi:hypothetical protein
MKARSAVNTKANIRQREDEARHEASRLTGAGRGFTVGSVRFGAPPVRGKGISHPSFG